MSFVNRAVEAGEPGRGEMGRRLAPAAELASKVRTTGLEPLDDRGGNSHPGVEFLEALLSTGLNCTFSLRRLSPELTSVTPSKLRSWRRAAAEPVVAPGGVGGAGDASPAGADSPAGPAAFGPERSAEKAGEKDQQRKMEAART